MAGRPREFDVNDAIDDALGAFWSNGVHATSMSDILDATGLSTGSIYKAFGTKQGLLHAVLRRYLDQQFAELRDVLDNEDPVAGIRALMENIIETASEPGPRRGCFATNCSIELAESEEFPVGDASLVVTPVGPAPLPGLPGLADGQ